MRLAVIAVALLCLAPQSLLAQSGSASSREPSTRVEVEALAKRINQHRVAIGCRPLILDRGLSAVALRHSQDMVRRGFFDHTNPDGRDPFDRLKAAGIHFRAAAENIAKGRASGRETYEDWIHSPGHQHNIENCVYTHCGIGLYRRTWSLELVRYADDRAREPR